LSYAKAVERACIKAKVEIWRPNRLRHTMATHVRAQAGLEAAQILLGHSRCDVTQVYAEVNEQKAVEVVKLLG
jgi:site-specific recombinase XerD